MGQLLIEHERSEDQKILDPLPWSHGFYQCLDHVKDNSRKEFERQADRGGTVVGMMRSMDFGLTRKNGFLFRNKWDHLNEQ